MPANLSLSKIESALLSDRDSHYYLADKLEAGEAEYDFVLVDAPPKLINMYLVIHFLAMK